MGLSTQQRKMIENIAKEYGNDIKLGELLAIKDNTPIENVIFSITGTYVYAYESTGNHRTWTGTIKEILKELDSWRMFDNPEAKISELIEEDELTELAKFFLGERNDRCLDYVTVDNSREVTLEEVRDYIGNLEVWSDFNYETTCIDF